MDALDCFSKMFKKIFLFVIYFLGFNYLLTPAKPLPFLDNAVLSNEPGDTWQHPDQRGFYTNLNRYQVLNEIQNKLQFSVFGLNIPSYRLNYRPEEAHELVRDQLKSYYLEEIVYPLHSSVFVNGWEPKKSPANANKSLKEFSDLSIYGVPYEAKITLMPLESYPASRILIWTSLFPLFYLVKNSLKKSLNHGKK